MELEREDEGLHGERAKAEEEDRLHFSLGCQSTGGQIAGQTLILGLSLVSSPYLQTV